MTSVDVLAAKYRAATPTPSGESPEKVDVISALGDQLPDREALRFLLAVLRDPEEYDLARIEVCRILRARFQRDDHTAVIGDSLAACLSTEEDPLVRQWLANACVPYAHVPSLYDRLLICVADPAEDDAVRHSALVAIEHLGPIPDSVQALNAVRPPDPLAPTIQQVLERWRSPVNAG
jgi:hypothetical protein